MIVMKKRNRSPGLGTLFTQSGVSPWLLAPGLLLLVQSALLSLAPLALVYGLIDQLGDPDADRLTNYIHLTLVAIALAAFLAYAGSAWCAWIAAHLLAGMRERVGKALCRLSLREWMQDSSIGMRQRLEDNLDGIGVFVSQQIPAMARALCIPIILVAALLAIDWRLALASLLPLPVAVLLVVYSARRKAIHNVKEDYYAARTRLHERMIEYFSSLPAVKMFSNAGAAADAVESTSQNGRRGLLMLAIEGFASTMQGWIAVVTPPWSRFYAYLTNANLPILALGVWLYQERALSAETLLLFALLGGAYIRPLFALANSGSQMALVKEAVRAFNQTLANADVRPQGEAPPPQGNDLEVENLSFAYGEQPALHNISLRLPAGGTIALVGPSGSGKSTLALLLAGVLAPAKGRVRLGGVDLAVMSMEQRNCRISLVLQHTSLLQADLAENIALAEEAHTPEVAQALQAAQLGGLLDSLPEGLHTRLGSDRAGFSGGETQRVQIARAIHKHAPLVILDEATAFCDADNEAAIQQAIAALGCETLIVITHRLASIANADLVVVLDEGRVAASGAHQELLQTSPLYQRLWRAQQP